MSIKDYFRIWIHKTFHDDKHDEVLLRLKREYYDQDDIAYRVCKKCGVYSEDFGYEYEEEQRVGGVICKRGDITHLINYYPTDKEYIEVRNKQLIKKLIK